jgi:hypothetical protein
VSHLFAFYLSSVHVKMSCISTINNLILYIYKFAKTALWEIILNMDQVQKTSCSVIFLGVCIFHIQDKICLFSLKRLAFPFYLFLAPHTHPAVPLFHLASMISKVNVALISKNNCFGWNPNIFLFSRKLERKRELIEIDK